MPTNLFENIPLEMREYKSWCVWKKVIKNNGEVTKVPFQANGEHAKSNDPNTWMTFEQVLACAPMYDGIGFILSKNDPYTLIDLDDKYGTNTQETNDRHLKIFNEFDSYSERSPSRTGCHIIVKGSVPKGCNRASIEIYSDGRFMTMTGDTWAIRPIVERNDLLNQLHQQITADAKVYDDSIILDKPQTLSDEEVIQQATNAVNGYKFSKLYAGEWQEFYPIQVANNQGPSEADLALVNMFGFYTQNREQVERLFKSSALGKRDKAKRADYINWMINKSFDNQLPLIDFEGYKEVLNQKLANDAQSASVVQLVEPAVHNSQVAGSNPAASTTHQTSAITFPPGLVGRIAQYSYDCSPTPVIEIALCSALALMAGICGRSHTVSNTGLNLYLCMLSPSGTGKESGGKSVTTLMSAVKRMVPNANFIGPGEIVSGPALYKTMASNPCYLSILGEFGLTLQEMSSKNASSAQISLRKMLLQLFNKSGPNDVLHPIVYSDKANNTAAVNSPCLSLLCDSAPEIFYNNLDESMIVGGLIPRFVFFEYNEFDTPYNHNHHKVEPPNDLLTDLIALSLQALSTFNIEFKNDLKPVRGTIGVPIDDDAYKLLEDFRQHVNFMMGNKELTRNLWNRAHVNAWKIAALIAIGENLLFPQIKSHNILWACKLVELSCTNLSKKFASGEVGRNSNEIKQEIQIARIIKEYLTVPFAKVKKYYIKSEKMHFDKIIPVSYVSQRLGVMPIFQDDKLGKTGAIKRVIKTMIDEDKLREVNKDQLDKKYGTKQQCFTVHDLDLRD